MERTIQLSGIITTEGKPMISGMERFNEFFKKHPNSSFIMELSAHHKGTTDAHVWYIMKMIVPAFIKGFRELGKVISMREAYNEILDCCPIFAISQRINHKIFDWDKFKPDCKMSPEELE